MKELLPVSKPSTMFFKFFNRQHQKEKAKVFDYLIKIRLPYLKSSISVSKCDEQNLDVHQVTEMNIFVKSENSIRWIFEFHPVFFLSRFPSRHHALFGHCHAAVLHPPAVAADSDGAVSENALSVLLSTHQELASRPPLAHRGHRWGRNAHTQVWDQIISAFYSVPVITQDTCQNVISIKQSAFGLFEHFLIGGDMANQLIICECRSRASCRTSECCFNVCCNQNTISVGARQVCLSI